MKNIESTNNPAVKEAMKLKVKKGRTSSGKFLIEGPNLTEAARASRSARVHKAFVTEEFVTEHSALIDALYDTGSELITASTEIIAKLSETESPQGVVSVVSYKEPKLPAPEGVLVVLDTIQDPGNLGTIIRTADAAGATAVVLTEGSCDPYSPKAMRSSAGSVFNVPIVFKDKEVLIEELKEAGVPVVVTMLNGVSIFDAPLAPTLAIVFGNEAQGVSAEFIEMANSRVTIPIAGRAESLNVASAAAIILFEVTRRTC